MYIHLCAFLSYFLYILILKFKNSCSEKLVCFVKLNIFLIYKTIKLETNLREAGKSIDISYHVTYAFQSESTLYICLNVKELLA